MKPLNRLVLFTLIAALSRVSRGYHRNSGHHFISGFTKKNCNENWNWKTRPAPLVKMSYPHHGNTPVYVAFNRGYSICAQVHALAVSTVYHEGLVLSNTLESGIINFVSDDDVDSILTPAHGVEFNSRHVTDLVQTQ